MIETLRWLGVLLITAVRERRDLAFENLALRQQQRVLKRRNGVPRPKRKDRLFWVVLSRIWSPWRRALQLVKAETVDRLATKGVQNLLSQDFAAEEWRPPASEFGGQSLNQ